MPRRPSKKHSKSPRKPRPIDRRDSKLKKWERASEITMDEEDMFHASRDKVLLDNDYSQDEDGDGDDDEVFALNAVTDEDDEDEQVEDEGILDDDLPDIKKLGSSLKKSDKIKKAKKYVSSEEEEQLESEDEPWGRGKAVYYASNALELESDDEEGNELEEQEARRLQAKAREGMKDEDFGLNDDRDIQSSEAKENLGEMAIATTHLLQDKKQVIRHLEKTNPEALALARDWEDIAHRLSSTREKLIKMQSEKPDSNSLGMMHLFYQTLLSYATALAFYLHLRAMDKYTHQPELLKSHPIMTRLLTLKQSLQTLDDLDFALSDSEDDDEEEGLTWEEIMEDGGITPVGEGEGLEEDELQELLAEAAAHTLDILTDEVPKRKRKPTTDPQPTASVPPPKKRRKSTDMEKPGAAAIFDLTEPEFPSSTPSSSHGHTPSWATDAFGEATSLQYADAADKSARKKSLRFHTSKIESVSVRRQGARNRIVRGDDDIPYRERRKERETRRSKDAAARSRGQGGEDLNDTEPDSRQRTEPGEEDDSQTQEKYYELVKNMANARKERKVFEYEANHARPDMDEETANGPRSLTRAILANKGLTPHRPKAVRNPRVKKRQKFEKAKKKLSSQKAVYKGWSSEFGKYTGEKSGISKIVKSTRLG